MSSKLSFNTLDVFTTTLYTGNQLALIHVPTSTPLSPSQQQTIAKEFNYSETVFLHEKKPSSNSTTGQIPTYDAQIFTPKSELPFAGHPTIGTAVWIFQNLERETDEIVVNLKAGPVKATFDRATGRARCEIPQEVHVHSARIPSDRVTAIQPSLSELNGTQNVPVNVTSIVRGVTFALINLTATPHLLSAISVTKDNVLTPADLDAGWPTNLQGDVFYTIKPAQPGDDDTIRIRQRVIVIELEDPATGAASAALTGFLALQRGEGGKTYQFEIEQGVEMGRRSVIGVEVGLTGDGKGVERVALLGQAVEVMEGMLRI